MPHWIPSWPEAWGAALVLALVSRLLVLRLRGPGVLPALLRETAIVAALFGLWQFVGTHAVRAVGDAVGRGEAIWHVERMFHLPSEAAVQRLTAPHPWLVQFFNGYYVYAHFSTLGLMLLWVFLRHRAAYPQARNAVVLTTFACLAISLVAVAPPRLLDGRFGITDSAAAFGQSVYGPPGTGIADQFSAMPSVHVAWAALVGVLVYRTARGRARWLGPLHLFLTLVVVVSTGNHYWLDAAVAGLIVAASVVATDRASAGAVDRNDESRADPPHAAVGQPAESLDEHGH
ncbi:MAG: hypothetical protein QOJ32_2499 [Frankiaceae bacterium]|nr:hypothetical protein [Frankiaceae bacterium]